MTDEFLDTTIQSLRYHLRALNRSASTLTQYESAFRRFYQTLPDRCEAGLRAVTRKQVEQYLAGLTAPHGGTLAPATRRYQFAGLQGFFKWYAGVEEIPDPMFGMRGPSVPETQKDVVAIEDVRKVLVWLDRQKNYRDAALISLMFEVGVRVSEACNLEWRSVLFKDQLVSLAETKNGTARSVPFEAATGRRLDLLHRKRADKMVPWVFPGRYGKALTRSGALQLVKKHFATFGIEGISPHDLRHSFATAFMDANPDGEATLQVVGGWKSRTMVARYSKQGRDRRAIEDFRRRSPTSQL